MFHSANVPSKSRIVQKNPYFLSLFGGKKEIKLGKIKKKGCCSHKLQTMTHFFTNQLFDPLSYPQPKMLDTHLHSFFFSL